MGLNFLSKAGVNTSADALSLSPEAVELENDQLRQEEVEIAGIKREIAESANAIEHVLSAVDVATGLTANDVPANLVGAVFGEHLVAAGVPEELAEEKAVGAESAGEEIGNEVLDTAKDIVMNIVNWLIGKWKDLKALLKRTFAKHFGSIKRNLAAYRKVKSRIEEYQNDGRTVEDKAKLDIKSGADYMVLGASDDVNPKAVVAWSVLSTLIEAVEKVITNASDEIDDMEVCDAGSLSELTTTKADIEAYVPESGAVEFKTGADVKISTGAALLGRKALVAQSRNAADIIPDGNVKEQNEAGLRETKKFLNGVTVAIRPSNIKLKKLEEVKVEVASLDDLEAVVDAHIELATQALALETSKKVVKLEKQFDKAIANAKKWSKDTDSDSAEDKRKAIAAAGMMSSLLNVQQDISIGLIGDLISYASSLGKAHGAVISKVLARYKKA